MIAGVRAEPVPGVPVRAVGGGAALGLRHGRAELGARAAALPPTPNDAGTSKQYLDSLRNNHVKAIFRQECP